jgi:hypothetical protein
MRRPAGLPSQRASPSGGTWRVGGIADQRLHDFGFRTDFTGTVPAFVLGFGRGWAPGRAIGGPAVALKRRGGWTRLRPPGDAPAPRFGTAKGGNPRRDLDCTSPRSGSPLTDDAPGLRGRRTSVRTKRSPAGLAQSGRSGGRRRLEGEQSPWKERVLFRWQRRVRHDGLVGGARPCSRLLRETIDEPRPLPLRRAESAPRRLAASATGHPSGSPSGGPKGPRGLSG